jgi:hypothetical protein
MRYEVGEAKIPIELYLSKAEVEMIILAHIKAKLEAEGKYYRDDRDKIKMTLGTMRGWDIKMEVRLKPTGNILPPKEQDIL